MLITERSFVATRIYTDEHIEYWGIVYVANPRIAARGVRFETFLLAPEEILAACSTPIAMSVARPGLLPCQRATQARIDLDAALRELGEMAIAALAAEAHCANGTWVEKLRHHAWGARKRARRELREVAP